ncbi:hypothetical protein PAXRUDRAFT_733631 [Paxillus rubicundulus Ve08.2h10]|uniref:Uncharacterized protein n=1 Tax=Paxillus rubicundulus Ve08.2h10 TaxID=930991 RepID=A0A0D0CH55_9AGAM|nr:hypothetical protein PAXRUDRAFT_733631 [Paxillus rubicundulus Ve08.2h10]
MSFVDNFGTCARLFSTLFAFVSSSNLFSSTPPPFNHFQKTYADVATQAGHRSGCAQVVVPISSGVVMPVSAISYRMKKRGCEIFPLVELFDASAANSLDGIGSMLHTTHSRMSCARGKSQ